MQTENSPSRNNPQILPTQPNSVYLVTSSPQSKVSPIPKTLILLLVLLIFQLGLGIAVLVLKAVMRFIGFKSITPIAIDTTTCTDAYILGKYNHNQKNILAIAIVMISLSILLTTVLLIPIIRAIIASRKLSNQPSVITGLANSTPALYRVLTPKIRRFCYILQSLGVIASSVVFGYYLSYYISFFMRNPVCPINNTVMKTIILIIWILAAALVAFSLAVWIIIAVICLDSNRQNDYLDEQQVKHKTYYTINNTQMTQQGNTHYRDPLLPKTSQPGTRPANLGLNNKTPQKGNNNLYPSSSAPRVNEKDYLRSEGNKGSVNNNFYSSPTNANQEYENPVFRSRKQIYESPYRKIETGKEEKNNKELQFEMVAIQQKDKQFRRSRFNTNSNEYKLQNVPGDDEYLRALSRHRVDQQQRDFYRNSPPRKILPESRNYSSPTGQLAYEGGNKARLHSTYFRDETSMLNKKRYQNSDEKKKRKGILNQYIRSKYVDS